MKLNRAFGLFVLLSIVANMLAASPAAAMPAGAAPSSVPVMPDSAMQVLSITMGGASVLPTTRTVPHWWGSTLDPADGVTYGYNTVGADPNHCAGADCSVTVQVDITPINVNVGGTTFDSSDVLAAVLASPMFTLNDYGSTPAATVVGAWPYGSPAFPRGPGGVLSQDDAGNALQLEDATMRAQFNQAGDSSYHLILQPHVMPTAMISVPLTQGSVFQSGRGVLFGFVNTTWWTTQIDSLEQQADATHLALYLTNDVLLYMGRNETCCVIGFHGTRAVGRGGGSTNTNGNAVVQTFAWGTYMSPGLYVRPDTTNWAIQDILPLSHEIAEWADDPFVNNWVQPWISPLFACYGLLETGDPVNTIGFAMGTNTFQQGPNPNGTQSADGYYHPEDEMFLPWFLRAAPNSSSEATQNPSANMGRYSFMGDLNPMPVFRAPAPGC